MKYPKFGHQRYGLRSKFVRYGLITGEEAIELVKKHDRKIDRLVVRDFVNSWAILLTVLEYSG